MSGSAQTLAGLPVAFAGLLRRFDHWLLEPAPPERLAALRVLSGGFVLVYVIVLVGEFRRFTRLSDRQFEPIGIAGLLDGPVPSTIVWAVFVTLIVSGLAFVTGTFFRVSGPCFALLTLAFASYHSSWGQMLHFEHLFTLHLLILGFSPAAAAWSVDAQRRGSPALESDVRYGWPIRLAAVVTVATYVIAGVAKLRIGGLDWVNATTLRNHIAYSATRMDLLGERRPPLASFVVGRPWLVAPMAATALMIELSAPLALLGRRLRNSWLGAVVLMHLGTAATMFVWFPYQGLGFAFLPFVSAELVISRRRRRRSGSIVVEPRPVSPGAT